MAEEEKKQEQHDEVRQEEKKTETEKQPLLSEPIKVQEYIYMSILSLDAKAWAYMDLVVHPETQKHHKDMEQAKLAIDTIDAIFKMAQAHFSPEQKKDIQARLANLKLNFVKR